MYKITAKNPKYSGYVGNCYFDNGIGYTDNKKLLPYFKGAGYTVDEVKDKSSTKKKGEEVDEVKD